MNTNAGGVMVLVGQGVQEGGQGALSVWLCYEPGEDAASSYVTNPTPARACHRHVRNIVDLMVVTVDIDALLLCNRCSIVCIPVGLQQNHHIN